MALRKVQEVLPALQVHQLRFRRTLGEALLGSYVIRLKVLPTGPEVPVPSLLESIKGNLGPEMTLRSSREEPIAFGLYALIVDVVAPEEEGEVDKVEKAVSTAKDVAQYELTAVSRMSSTLKV